MHWGKEAVAFARVELPKVITEKADNPEDVFKELAARWKSHLGVHGVRMGVRAPLSKPDDEESSEAPKSTRRRRGAQKSSGNGDGK
jgi:hypothetical protein